MAEPTGHEPPRHEPGRGRRASAEPRGLRPVRTSSREALARTDVASRGHAVTVDVSAGPPARPRRRGVHGPDPVEHPRQRRQVRRTRMRRSGSRPSVVPERARQGDGRGRRPGRPGRGAAAAVREVLSRPAQGRGFAPRDGDRPGGRPRPRSRRWADRSWPGRARWAASPSTSTSRSRPRGAERAVAEAGGSVTTRAPPPRSSSSRMTSRPVRSIAMFLRGYHHDVVEAGDAATAIDGLGAPAAGPHRARPRPARRGRPRADPARPARGDDADPRSCRRATARRTRSPRSTSAPTTT